MYLGLLFDFFFCNNLQTPAALYCSIILLDYRLLNGTIYTHSLLMLFLFLGHFFRFFPLPKKKLIFILSFSCSRSGYIQATTGKTNSSKVRIKKCFYFFVCRRITEVFGRGCSAIVDPSSRKFFFLPCSLFFQCRT